MTGFEPGPWVTACGSGTCVAVRKLPDTVHIGIMDGGTPMLTEGCYPTHDEWREFVAGVKRGEFDNLLD